MSKRRCDPTCPLCIEGKRARCFHVGHYGCPGKSVRRRVQVMALRRRVASVGERQPPVRHVPTGDPFAERYPSLFEFLTAEVFEDGSGRQPGTVLVVFEDLRFRCWVNDKEAGESAWVSASSLAALWQCVEQGLAEGTLEWRRPRKGPGKRA